MFKKPEFWKDKNIISLLLLPIGLVYYAIHKILYALHTPVKFHTKVICIGNVTLGGSGKTPCAIALGKLLKAHKYKIAYVCKNYMAKLEGPMLVNSRHKSPDVIEEALLLSKVAPTYVGKNRLQTLRMADMLEYDFIIVDDGLQNNTFYKDLSILMIGDKSSFGNGLIFPAGPLRETLKSGKAKAQLALSSADFDKEFKLSSHKKTSKYIAFSGIANPENFFESLVSAGLDVLRTVCYADHHHYSDSDIEDLIKKAQKHKCKLVTTEKDFIKIPNQYHDKIDYLEMTMKFKDEKAILKQVAAL